MEACEWSDDKSLKFYDLLTKESRIGIVVKVWVQKLELWVAVPAEAWSQLGDFKSVAFFHLCKKGSDKPHLEYWQVNDMDLSRQSPRLNER